MEATPTRERVYGGVRRVYPGGVYHSTPSVFERLDDENIRVSESLRYYPYRATFDFECWFDTEQLPPDSDQVHWVARHVPLSVSVASNIPGHVQVKYLVTDGDTNKLVSTMMDILRDMTNFIAPGFSYDKYLKAYGCEVMKGYIPYEYMDRLERLDDTTLPPKEAFLSRLKNEGISDEDYASCQEAWCDNGMTTLRDFLVWYNNSDVVPFLQVIDRHFAFYQKRGIDMFKQGISVPGLTLLYLFNDLPEKTYFTTFNEKNKDLHNLVKDNIIGGPSIIFHRYHEKGVTTLRQNEYGEAAHPCRSIVGYDANALYLWSLMQYMPMGWYTRRRAENDFRPE